MPPSRSTTLSTAISDFRAVFNLFDRDGNAVIDAKEFAEILQLLGDQRPSQEQLHQYLRVACGLSDDDPVPDGVNFTQFLTFFAEEREENGAKVGENEMFRVLDRNRDGRVGTSELQIAMEGFGMKLSDEEVKAMLHVVKEPGAEDISFNDFEALVRRVETLNEDRKTSFDSDSSCTVSFDKGHDD